MNRRMAQWVAGTVVALAFAALAAGLWWRPGAPDYSSGPLKTLVAERDCDPAQRACGARGEDLRLQLRLGPPVTMLRTFPVTVQVHPHSAFAVHRVEVNFAMVGMDMGVNRYRLASARDGRWEGSALLPVCASGRSDWMVTVALAGPDGRREARFGFQAGRP